jgi:competence protein ComEC
VAVLTTRPDDKLHVSFLDVGQGDATLIKRGNQEILVDGGPSPQQLMLSLSSKIPFWDRSIDLVVMTHPDADHLSGLVEVLKRYDVAQVLYPDFIADTAISAEWLRLIAEKNIKSNIARAGQEVYLGETRIAVLNPGASTFTGDNENSIVLRVTNGKVSFLLTADIPATVEYELMNTRAELDSDVLKVSHHGSATASSIGFLAVVSPQVAVISVGTDNQYGLPDAAVVSRIETAVGKDKLYRTDADGTIEFVTDGITLWVETEK